MDQRATAEDRALGLRSELEAWHDWTDPDFFRSDRQREGRFLPLFLRQILPGRVHRTKLTITGWFLILVALGIGSAAYNTSSNILFMTLSLLLSSLVLSGILSLINFKKLDWSLSGPSHLRAGELGLAEIGLRNGKRVFPTMSLCFRMRTTEADAAASLHLPHGVAAGDAVRLEQPFTPRRRGRFAIRIDSVESLYPFGFLRKSISTETSTAVLVWPARIDYDFESAPGGQRYASGVSRRNPGQGSDLLNIRPYHYGDAPRLVHWRATARTGKLMIRQLAQEGESGYLIDVDPDAALWGEGGDSFETLCSLVCSMAEDLFQIGRLDGYRIGGGDIEPTRNLRELHELFDALALLEPQRSTAPRSAPGRARVIAYRPGREGVAIYVDEKHSGQANG